MVTYERNIKCLRLKSSNYFGLNISKHGRSGKKKGLKKKALQKSFLQ